MKSPNRFFAAWQFRLKQALQQSGWQPKTGLFLLFIAISVAVFYLKPQQQRLTTLQAELAQLEQYALKSKQHDYGEMHNDIANQFSAILPAENGINRKIAQLLAAADRAGLTVDKADYHRQFIKNSDLVQLHIQLPVSGSYVQMRQFIDQAFNALPTLALSDITFNRDDVGSDFVESDMQFNLYLRQEKSLGQAKP